MQARRTELTKTVRARYTLECKQEAVRLVEGGQIIAAAARSLGVQLASRQPPERLEYTETHKFYYFKRTTLNKPQRANYTPINPVARAQSSARFI